jgi:hypothetical protein
VFCLFLLCYILQKADLLDYNIEHVKIVLHVKTFILFQFSYSNYDNNYFLYVYWLLFVHYMPATVPITEIYQNNECICKEGFES